jgi:hypothetical protein
MRPFDKAVRYYNLARTMERPYNLLPATEKLHGHAAKSYDLARMTARLAVRNRSLARFWHEGTATGTVSAEVPQPRVVGRKVLRSCAGGAEVPRPGEIGRKVPRPRSVDQKVRWHCVVGCKEMWPGKLGRNVLWSGAAGAKVPWPSAVGTKVPRLGVIGAKVT